MTSIKTIAVAGLLSVVAAAPAFAQAAIQEPGLFAFNHPNLDVLNNGAPTPASRLESLPPSVTQAYSERESGMTGAPSGIVAKSIASPAARRTAVGIDGAS